MCVADNHSAGGAAGPDGGAAAGAGGGDQWVKRRADSAERAGGTCARLTGPDPPSQGQYNHSFLPSHFLT